MSAMRRIDVAPARFTVSTAAAVELPVASIGSRRMTSRSARSSGKLHVVLDRLERLLVAEKPDEADARARDEREHRVEHAHARTQDRADGDLLARDPSGGRVLERRLDLDRLVGEALRRLVGEEQRELVDELAEHLRRRRDVAQQAELVLDERMRDLGDEAGG